MWNGLSQPEAQWTLLVVLGFPLLTVVLIEMVRRFGAPESLMRRPLRALQNIVLPAGVVWIIVHHLAQLPADGLAVKIVDTVVGVLLLQAIFTILQSLLIAFSETVGRLPAPRLFYELASSAVVAVGAAIIVSTIWGVDLGSLLGALGIGSVVLGLALQNVIGGLVAGVIVFSGRHFTLGDWLVIDGAPARVVQIDWRAITVETLAGQRVVIPSASMSGDVMRITRANQPVWVDATVTLPLDTSPEAAKAALREAAFDVPQLLEPARLSCRIAAMAADGVQYTVRFLVADATQVGVARDTLLHRLWYVGQRHALAIGGGAGMEALYGADTAENRARALAESGAFGGNAADLMEMAAAARLLAFCAGEKILRHGASTPSFLVMLSGAAQVSLPIRGGVNVERLVAGDLYATRDVYRGTASQVDLTADEEVRLLSIPVSAMERLLERNPVLAEAAEVVIDSRTEALLTASSLAQGRLA